MAPISLDAWLLHQLTFPDRVALFQTGVDPNSVFWALEFTTNHKIFWILPACTVQRHALQYKLKQRTMESWRPHGSSLGSPVLSYGHWTTSSPLYILLASHFPLISSHNIKPCKMEAIATCLIVKDLFHNEFGRLVIEPKEFNVDSCRQCTVKAAKLSLVPRPCAFVAYSTKFAQRAWARSSRDICRSLRHGNFTENQ